MFKAVRGVGMAEGMDNDIPINPCPCCGTLHDPQNLRRVQCTALAAAKYWAFSPRIATQGDEPPPNALRN
jgi:hypothetical protein